MDTKNGKVLRVTGNRVPNSLATSPDDILVLSGTDDGTIFMWHVPTGQSFGQFRSCEGAVKSIVFGPDDRGFLSGSKANTIDTWEIDFVTLNEMIDASLNIGARKEGQSCAKYVQSLTGHTGDVNCLSISPGGRWIASSSWDYTVMFWDGNGDARLMLKAHKGVVISTDFSPSGTFFATAGLDKKVKIWGYSMV
ncbi:WD40 repeat-like protein [Serendipita vermifera]|nr:WD40 repeat-like protein [Serendipita vermifera]